MTRWDKMKQTFQHLYAQFSLWMLLPMCAFASLGACVYMSSVDYTLTTFVDRIIGIAVAGGYNPAIRKTTYFAALLIWLVLAAIAALALTAVRKALKNKSLNFLMERDIFIAFSLLLIYCTVSGFSSLFTFNGNETPWQHANTKWIAALLLALTVHCAIRYMQESKLSGAYERDAGDASFGKGAYVKLALAFMLPFPLVFAFQCVVSPNNFIILDSAQVYLLYIGLFIALRLILPKINTRRAVISSIPLLLIPLSFCIAEEIQYSIRFLYTTTTRKIGVVLFIVLFALSILCYFTTREKKKRYSCDQLLSYLLYPLLLISLTSIMTHVSTLEPVYDLLHTGNAITPVQQLVQYGQVPFLDYWGAQHFQFGALFYSLINGSHTLEPLIWNNWFSSVIFILILYYFIGELYGHRWAFLVCTFLPVLEIVETYYLGAFLPLLVLYKLVAERKQIHYILFLGLSLFAFACMPSQGMAAVVAAYVILLALGFTKDNIKKALFATLVVFIIPAIIYFGIIVLKGYTIGGQFALIKGFASTDNYEGPYSVLFNNQSDFLILLQYAILPLINVLICVRCLLQKQKSAKDYLILFTAIASIAISTRVLGRHCLLEDFQGMLYVPVLLTLPVLKKKGSQSIKQGVSLLVLTTYAFVIIGNISDQAIANQNTYSYRSYFQEDQRYTPDESQVPTGFTALIDEALTEDQTFFDMTSSHLLYTLTNRKAPFLHHAVHVSQAEDAQLECVKRISALYDNNELPLVLWGGTELEYMDSIPMALCCFHITEFIYTHYRPWLTVDGYQLWVANNSTLPRTLDEQTGGSEMLHNEKIKLYDEAVKPYAQDYNYFRIPYIWGTVDNAAESIKASVQEAFAKDVSLRNGVLKWLPIPGDYDKSAGSYLYFKITSPCMTDCTMTISFGKDLQNQIIFTVVPGTQDYLIRISTVYAWMHDQVQGIMLDPKEDYTIESAAILRGD